MFSTFLIVALTVLTVTATNNTDVQPYSFPTDNQMIDALQLLIQYYENNVYHIIVDAYYGLRAASELIQQTIYSYQNGLTNLDKNQIHRVKQLYRDSVRILSQIDQLSNKNLTEHRYRGFYNMLHTPFPWPKHLTQLKFIKESAINSTDNRHISYMAISDTCLLDMMGGGLHDRPPCIITDSCWKGITNFGADGYNITHQFLAIFVGEQFNCTRELNQRSRNLGGTERVKRILCTHIYYEMMEMLNKGLVNGTLQDLFTEQIYICGGGGGYKQFLRREFLAMILKWRNKDGCFLPYHGPYITLHPKLVKNNTVNSSKTPMTSRKLLEHADSLEGCDQHTTSLATIDIALYLRWYSLREFSSPTTIASNTVNNKPTILSPGIIGAIIITIAVIVIVIAVLFIYFVNPFHHERQGYRAISSSNN